MASISYWFLSPSVFVALLGKLKGWDRTRPTPAFDWKKATVDVVIPTRNEEATVALSLASLLEQDFPFRRVTVIDDGSQDKTVEVVRRFSELSGKNIEVAVREKSMGKTQTLRKQCRLSDADALVILDGDTVLADRTYLSRVIEELFKNAGTASACGEVMPLTRRRRRMMAEKHPIVGPIEAEFKTNGKKRQSRLRTLLEACTVIYRSTLYLFLHRILYDGQLKLFGSRLNPIGCAVAYRTERLRECFDHAEPRMGDNLSTSEDVFIGHFFAWKGYRNAQVRGALCESIEPTLDRLPRQLFLWSSSFLQAQYYFMDLPLSPFRRLKHQAAGLFARAPRKVHAKSDNRRVIQEQYRFPWGEAYTHRYGRGLGWADLLGMFEKVSYPLLLLYFAIFNPRAALLTIAVDAILSTVGVFTVADKGTGLKYAGMMLAATPIRLFSLGVDLAAVLKYLIDVGVTGNRAWRK